MRVAIVVPFLNEAAFLPRFLHSVAEQTRRPDLLLLIDDGSADGSAERAEAFAARHSFATAVRRPARPPAVDRLASASVVKAFHWGLERIGGERWDVIAKMDADLELAPDHVETVLGAFEADPALGVAGAYLSICGPGGELRAGGAPERARARAEQVLPPGVPGRDRADPGAPRVGHDRRAAGADEGLAHDEPGPADAGDHPPAPDGRPRRPPARLPEVGAVRVGMGRPSRLRGRGSGASDGRATVRGGRA